MFMKTSQSRSNRVLPILKQSYRVVAITYDLMKKPGFLAEVRSSCVAETAMPAALIPEKMGRLSGFRALS
jgi:hypothetical protein